jgi:hypothetical protein
MFLGTMTSIFLMDDGRSFDSGYVQTILRTIPSRKQQQFDSEYLRKVLYLKFFLTDHWRCIAVVNAHIFLHAVDSWLFRDSFQSCTDVLTSMSLPCGWRHLRNGVIIPVTG